MYKINLWTAPFKKIKNGQKTIELRLYDKKRRLIKVGDTITFTNNASGETLSTAVKKLHRFDSFAELYSSLPLLQCGYTPENIERAHPSDMDRYYTPEAQSKHGVVGIELCSIKPITDESTV